MRPVWILTAWTCIKLVSEVRPEIVESRKIRIRSSLLSFEQRLRQVQREQRTDFVTDACIMSTAELNNTKGASVVCKPMTNCIACYENVTFTTKVQSNTFEHGLELEVNFVAFNRTFDLVLTSAKKPTVISSQLNIKLVGAETSKIHSSNIFDDYFSGYVRGKHSHFSGRYRDGTLDGILDMNDNIYYLEPIDRYFPRIGHLGRYRVVVYAEKVPDKLNVPWQQTYQRKNISREQTPGSWTFHATPVNIVRKSQHLHRRKRDFVAPYKVCELKIIVDYNFFNSYCSKSIKRVVYEAAHAVTLSDAVFRNVDFDFNGISDNIGFAIREMVIFENNNSSDYYLGNGHAARTLLFEFSQYDFSGYCLGVLLTYRNFDDNIIGLAWPASSSKHGKPGGICQKRSRSHKSFKSYNALLVTPLVRGTELSRRVLGMTMAHEMGHSFGAHHDPSPHQLCSPKGSFGTYLMSVMASDYSTPNSVQFSQCSILSMGPVVAHKATCLKVYDAHSLCGNLLIDPGEECDCGQSADTCQRVDSCCAVPERGKPGCHVPRELGKYCSPQTSQCCTQNCTVEPNPVVCRASTECSKESRCDTANVECPAPVPLADGKLCRGGTRVCCQGLCEVSRCVHHGWEDCQCRTTENELCQLCCKRKNDAKSGCVPAYKLADDDEIVRPIYRHLRELCNDNRGYCNKHHRCFSFQSIDPEDVFPLLFQPSTGAQITDWLLNYWYYFVIGLVLFLFIFNSFNVINDRRKPADALALWSAKMTTVWQTLDYNHMTLDEQLQHLYMSYETNLLDLETQPMDMVVAVSRMRIFFPTTPQHVIREVMSHSASEEFAVRCLLIRGDPMARQPCVNNKKRHGTCCMGGMPHYDKVLPMTPIETSSVIDHYDSSDNSRGDVVTTTHIR